MAAQKKLSKVAEAYQRCKIARDTLHALPNSKLMETVEDKQFGIVMERWILLFSNKHKTVMLYATPDWWDVYSPLTDDASNDATVEAIKAYAQ